MPMPTPLVRHLGGLYLLPSILVVGCASTAPTTPSERSQAEGQDVRSIEGEPASDERSPDAEFSNTLRWATASEVDNFGFDVYRSQDQDGPFVRLTETPVLGAGTSDLPSNYEYVDVTIDPRQSYFYYVESISMSGVRERFTPVIAAKPKIDPQGEADSES